ncbi:MAG: tetratricopeptide repeat protein [Rhodothermia bacterium]
MSSAWSQIDILLDQAFDLEPEAREDWVKSLDVDEDIRDEVKRLLAADSSPLSFLDQDIADFAAPAMQDEEEAPVSKAGRSVGPYTIIRELGHGGMGIVYLAERKDVGKKVALKLVSDRAADEHYTRRFLFEREVLARLQHPNIAQLLDAGVSDDGTPWFAMQYVNGIPVTTFCDDHRLGINERLELFGVVCQAVHHAHRHLVIHRDLKPSNIMVDEEGQVKLLDFGIAKLVESDQGDGVDLTQSGHRMMTPAYASPEQVTEQAVTTASDVYSLGILLYEILTGERPYQTDGLSHAEILKNVCDTIPATPSTAVQRTQRATEHKTGMRTSSLQRRLRGDLDKIVMMALRKEPERRYESAQAFVDDVKAHLAGLPVKAQPDSFSYRTRKFGKRHRLAVAGAIGAVALVIGFGLFYTIQISSERDRAKKEAGRAEEITSFLVDLFQANDPSEAKGDSITVSDVLARGQDRLADLAGQPELQAEMMATVAQVYRSLGNFPEAESLLVAAYEILKQENGPNDPAVVKARFQIAEVMGDLGDVEGSLEIHHEVLPLQERTFGHVSHEVGHTLSNMGYLHRVASRYDSAEVYYLQSIDVQRAVVPIDSSALGSTIDNFGVVMGITGRYDEAGILFSEALEIFKGLYGRYHPKVFTASGNVGTLYSRLGDLHKADSIQTDALEIARRIFPASHPKIGIAVSNLAAVESMLGNFETALPLYVEAREIATRTYGPEHLEVALETSSVGVTLYELGRLDEAEPIVREALEIRMRLVGEKHRATATNLNRLGQVRLAQGFADEAIELVGRSLSTRRELFGDEHRMVAESQFWLGLAYAQAGNRELAEQNLRASLELRRRLFGDDHPDTIGSADELRRITEPTGGQ